MRRPLLVAVVILLLLLGAAYLLGVRIFVMTPQDIPGGATLLMMSASDLSLVDSPAAYCIRHGAAPDALCRSGIGLTIGEGSVLARFGFVDWLYRLTGAPSARS